MFRAALYLAILALWAGFLFVPRVAHRAAARRKRSPRPEQAPA